MSNTLKIAVTKTAKAKRTRKAKVTKLQSAKIQQPPEAAYYSKNYSNLFAAMLAKKTKV